ncbi:MAG TPA: hypothetical protein VH372_15105 [Actinospica sp.]|nr:hypothetical protein [Actinospica sp.]
MTRIVRSCAVAALVVGAALAFVTGCAAAPAAPPQIPPTPGMVAVHQDTRITLPVTVGLAFHHPNLSDRTEYAVLFTVQQAMRSMVQAEYSTKGSDAELSQYWSGAGLSTVNAQINQWVKLKQQPVGVIVLEDTTYTAATGKRPAAVSFCADWSNVVRGQTRTHVVGSAVQAKNAKPTYERLGLSRAKDKRWRVNSLALSPNSPKCP